MTFVGAPTSFAEVPDLESARLRLATAVEGARVRVSSRDPALVFTLTGTARVERQGSVPQGSILDGWVLDGASWLVVPAGGRASLRVLSPTARVLAFEIDAARREGTLAQYAPEGMDRQGLAGVLGAARQLPRTTWVHELAHRYAFERAVCAKHASEAARFIETELTKEAFFLTTEAKGDRPRASLHEGHSDLVARAMAEIEASLARPLTVAELARRVGTSRRTLIRAFERELSTAPAAFLRGRRLEEARMLLRSGRYRVSEVAARVGYASAPAFSTAYAARFGRPPSADVTP